jgi:DNA-directed RNA polymerase specialized sigma24 family protein
MKHETNQSLMALLQDERPYFMNFALKKCKNKEISEDLIQSVLCKLLRIEVKEEIRNEKQFLLTMITRMYLNYKQINRKYIMVGDLHSKDNSDSGIILELLTNRASTCTYVGDLMDSFTVKEIKTAANNLPAIQRNSIFAALVDDRISADNGGSKKYNTQKSTRRLAIQKLKERFK